MRGIILWVRHLRHVPAFSGAIRALVIFLLVFGAWVATRKLEFPSGISMNDKLIHLIVFFGFALLMDLATSRHPFWLWKGLPLIFYGALIEVMQYFSPDRTFSLLDLAADFSGIVLYYMAKLIILWISSIKLINGKY